jgi:exosortase C (VPDSG-CTERM-specific)
MVPFPMIFRGLIETALQQGSASVADVLFTISNTPEARTGLVFSLPGINLEVAPECSGIHSTVALFITSLLAGYYFLKRPWKRWVICLAVVPLALLRNGFRVYVIGEMCVHIGPEMINSVVHRHGGPLFFLLSLIPFFYLIKYLRKGDRFENSVAGKNLSK